MIYEFDEWPQHAQIEIGFPFPHSFFFICDTIISAFHCISLPFANSLPPLPRSYAGSFILACRLFHFCACLAFSLSCSLSHTSPSMKFLRWALSIWCHVSSDFMSLSGDCRKYTGYIKWFRNHLITWLYFSSVLVFRWAYCWSITWLQNCLESMAHDLQRMWQIIKSISIMNMCGLFKSEKWLMILIIRKLQFIFQPTQNIDAQCKQLKWWTNYCWIISVFMWIFCCCR